MSKSNSRIGTLATAFSSVKIGNDVAVIDGLQEAIAANLPEGMTMDTIKQTHDLRSDVAAAALQAIKDPTHDYFKANKDAKEVSLTVPFGNDNMSFCIRRSSESRNPQTGEKSTVHGAVGFKYAASTRLKAGELKKTVGVIRAQFADLAD